MTLYLACLTSSILVKNGFGNENNTAFYIYIYYDQDLKLCRICVFLLEECIWEYPLPMTNENLFNIVDNVS